MKKVSISVSDEIILVVDYSRTLWGMIKAGNYSYANTDISEKYFPLPVESIGKQISILTKLVCFNRIISSQDAIVEIEKAGYQLAILPELLALGEAHPELQKKFPIVALGSVWTDTAGTQSVPAIVFDRPVRSLYKRNLHLNNLNEDWYSHYRFLVVCR